jgi:hypothetical protein
MSFDVFLFRFTPLREGLDEGVALLELLETVRALRCDSIVPKLTEHEGKAEIQIDVPLGNGYVRTGGAAFFLHSLSPVTIELIHAVAVAGDMVTTATVEPYRFILVRDGQRQHLPPEPDWDEPVVCPTPEDLGAQLLGGFDQWAAYRDQVLKGADSPPNTDDDPQ